MFLIDHEIRLTFKGAYYYLGAKLCSELVIDGPQCEYQSVNNKNNVILN